MFKQSQNKPRQNTPIKHQQPPQKTFNMKEFPELTKNTNQLTTSPLKVSYVEQIKKENIIPEDTGYKTPKGWTSLQQVKGRNQVIITRNLKEEIEIPETQKILNSLVSLDMKRKQHYLETWGEENYKKEFPVYEPIYSSSDDTDDERKSEYSDVIEEDMDIY